MKRSQKWGVVVLCEEDDKIKMDQGYIKEEELTGHFERRIRTRRKSVDCPLNTHYQPLSTRVSNDRFRSVFHRCTIRTFLLSSRN